MARDYREPVGSRYGSDDNDRDRWRENERERSSWRDRDEDRGFFERAGDEIRSWFGEDDDRRPRDSSWERERDRGFEREDRSSFGGMAQGGMSQSGYGRAGGGFGRDRDRFGPQSRGSSSFGEYRGDFRSRSGWRDDEARRGQRSWDRDRDRDTGDSHLGYGDFRGTLGGFGNQRIGISEDDFYRSWRDRQMEQLDRDYEEYRREREQQFHGDFDSWRRNRQGQGQSEQRSGSAGAGTSALAGVGTTTASMSGSAGAGSAIASGTTSEPSIQPDTTSTDTTGKPNASGGGRSGSRSRR